MDDPKSDQGTKSRPSAQKGSGGSGRATKGGGAAEEVGPICCRVVGARARRFRTDIRLREARVNSARGNTASCTRCRKLFKKSEMPLETYAQGQ